MKEIKSNTRFPLQSRGRSATQWRWTATQWRKLAQFRHPEAEMVVRRTGWTRVSPWNQTTEGTTPMLRISDKFATSVSIVCVVAIAALGLIR